MDSLSAGEGLKETGIAGVFLQKLKILPAVGGSVLHMLRCDSPMLADRVAGSFGEIYFSEVEAGAVKAWKRHRLQTQLFAVPLGMIKVVLYDSRQDSATHDALVSVFLGRPQHYQLLRIPNGIWYGFAAVGTEKAMICNCADLPHDPEESERLPWDSADIPYSWQCGQSQKA